MSAININFPNGKVNQEYSIELKSVAEQFGIAELNFEGLEDLGLQYDEDEQQITGVPSLAGDHQIVMKYQLKDKQDGQPEFLSKEITLIINPDPKELWKKSIPTPENIAYYKPDSNKEFVKVETKITKKMLGLKQTKEARKDLVAASQRGRSHAIEGKPRDDDFALFFDEASEWYVMTVADGAGSAKYSRKGSEIACQTVIEVCKEQIAAKRAILEKAIRVLSKEQTQENRNAVGKTLYEIVGGAAFKAYKNIDAEVSKRAGENEQEAVAIKDYSTTLLIAICKKFDFGWFIGGFWVGDGGMGIYRKEPEYLKILGEPDGGEYAGQTRFLTMSEIMQAEEIYRRVRFDIVPDFTALILMTDGITDPKFETDANLNRIEKWHQLWRDLEGENEDRLKVDFTDDNEQAADQLLQWLDFWSKGNHDDRTIAILF
ncbi:MAG: protein phosphatase 2C domain-containing protein [Culturomica sp.]|nr:protein phosphatase 2C domain-containing protein [Culturomica sp.]